MSAGDDDAYPDTSAQYANTASSAVVFPPGLRASQREAYPDTSAQYPNTSAQYPDTSAQYPDTNAQYPDTSAQYPDTSAQYGTAAYPDTSAQYGAAAAYPDSAQYPNTNAQYPNTSAQYPNTNNQYPEAVAQGGGASAQYEEKEEEVVEYQAPSWAKVPSNHPNVRLEVNENGTLLGRLPLGTERYVIVGRASGHVNIEVSDPTVAPVHAAIINSRSKTFVQDLGSRHGTFLNGRRIEAQKPKELLEKDKLRFGESDLVYRARGIKADVPSEKWAPPPWATPPARPCDLHTISKSSDSRSVTSLEQGCIVVGRMKQTEQKGVQSFVVKHDSVSRKHAAIVHRDYDSFIYDLGSTHGTFINKEQVEAHEPIPLESGMVIRFGKSSERFEFRTRKTKKRNKKREREEVASYADGEEEELPEEEEHASMPEEAQAPAQQQKTSMNYQVKPEGQQAVAYNPFSAIFGNKQALEQAGGGGFSWDETLQKK